MPRPTTAPRPLLFRHYTRRQQIVHRAVTTNNLLQQPLVLGTTKKQVFLPLRSSPARYRENISSRGRGTADPTRGSRPLPALFRPAVADSTAAIPATAVATPASSSHARQRDRRDHRRRRRGERRGIRPCRSRLLLLQLLGRVVDVRRPARTGRGNLAGGGRNRLLR